VLEANEGDAAAARRCYSRALDADGRNVPAFVAWALLEEKIGKVEDSRIILEKALTCFSPGSDEKNNLWRTYELLEQRQANVGAAQAVYQRAMRERMALTNDDTQFDEEMEAISKESVVGVVPESLDGAPVSSSSDEATDAAPTTKAKEDPKPEFEVVRWKNTGGEVWMKNDRGDIEAKIGPTKKQKRLSKKIQPMIGNDDE
jgi:tetratricopeptide (TPR) repeat protein